MQLLKDVNLNFTDNRRAGMTLSAIAIFIGLVSLLLHGGPRLGIDFEGGTLVQVRFENPVTSAEVRTAIASVGFGQGIIQQFGNDREVLIRVLESQSEESAARIIESALSNYFPENPYEIRREERVGPKIGSELRSKAILSILGAMIGIVIYITVRFEFKFAVGAIIALAHDVLITLGLFSILDIEINLAVIAAFLTIVGYSLNDTIVVYDRIRENIKVLRTETYEKVINSSINQSLSRTIVTSMTTFMVVFILYVLGGEVIRGFSLGMIFGVLVGTYSSIFIASPVLIEWQARTELKKRRNLSTA